MEVVVDGRTGLSPQVGATFRAIFETVRRQVKSRRRAIVAWTLDGERLTLEKQETLADQVPADEGLLEVRTVDPFEVAGSHLTGLRTHLANLEKNHGEAVAFVEAEEFSKALEKLEACFTGWDILARVIHDVGNLSEVDWRSLQAGGKPVEHHFRVLQDALVRFSAAMEFKDLGRGGELVRDELRPLLAEWKAVLEALAQHLARASGTAP